jgi:hypothetical protein
MSMSDSTINIVHLPDEILLTIFNKLSHIDMLYSLVGVNRKLDTVAYDINFTRTVDLTMASSNQMNDSLINNRFCMQILPRIHHHVECLTVRGCFLERVLHASTYPNLRKLIIVDLELNVGSRIFNGMSFDCNIQEIE